MTLASILTICYCVPSSLNSYCYLFQRTALKIRRYAVGSTGVGLEYKLLPYWYKPLSLFSGIRYIPLIWLLFVDWKLAIGLYFSFGIINLVWPVDDYTNTQKIKRYFISKKQAGTFEDKDEEFFNWVLAAELKMEEEPRKGTRKQVVSYGMSCIYLLICWLAYEFGGYLYAQIFK